MSYYFLNMIITYDDLINAWIQYVNSHHLLLVDFSAEWCEPCKILEPILERLSKDPKYQNIKFIRISDERRNAKDSISNLNIYLMNALNIQAIPTVVVYLNGKPVTIKKNGKEMNMLVGVQKEDVYRRVLDHVVENEELVEL